MNSIQEIVGFDVYNIICSYTDIGILCCEDMIYMYKCNITYAYLDFSSDIQDNYKLWIYLDHVNSYIVYKKDVKCPALTFDDKIVYYKEYIIIRSYSIENGMIIYNIKKKYQLLWSNLDIAYHDEYTIMLDYYIIKYFKSNPSELNAWYFSIKYICNDTYKYVITNHFHNREDYCQGCITQRRITGQIVKCNCADDCLGRRFIIINYKTCEVEILYYNYDCDL